MIVGAAHVVCVVTLEPKHDAVLIVHANGVMTRQVAGERMQAIPRRHAQVVELSHCIEFHNARGSRRAALLLTPLQMSRVASSAKLRIIGF